MEIDSFRRASLGYQVNLLARLLEQALRRQIADHGVVPGQFPALLALYERDGLTQAELCRLVRIEQPTMANTLNRMQRDGLVRRNPDPADGRRSLVRLSARARDLEQRLIGAADAVNAEATGGLTPTEAATLMDLLSKVITQFDGRGTAEPQTGQPGGTMPDTAMISATAPLVTLINSFTVEPDQQDTLVALLERATDEVMRHRPGFVSASIHRGLDGTTVANYAQWASRADFEAMLADPVAQKHMGEARAMAMASPLLYEVASVHS